MTAAATVRPLEVGEAGKARRAHELEGRLLGELMVSDCLTKVMEHIRRPDQFADHAHRVIFSAILGLRRDETEIDPVTVPLRLESLGQLEEAGWQTYVLQLAQSATGAGNGAAYAQVVAKNAEAREAKKGLGEPWIDSITKTPPQYLLISSMKWIGSGRTLEAAKLISSVWIICGCQT